MPTEIRYSTYRIYPEAAVEPDKARLCRLFVAGRGEAGQGFKQVTVTETGTHFPGQIDRPWFVERADWTVFWEHAPDQVDTLPLECRPAGLFVYGQLRFDVNRQGDGRWIPLTSGLPYGALPDSQILRGGTPLELALGKAYVFAVELRIAPAWRPVAPICIQVSLHGVSS